jgi:hypothetical protein
MASSRERPGLNRAVESDRRRLADPHQYGAEEERGGVVAGEEAEIEETSSALVRYSPLKGMT